VSEGDLKQTHRALIEAFFGGGDARLLRERIAPSHILHQRVVEALPPGRAAIGWAGRLMRATFGAAYVQIEDQIASGDRCFTRVIAQVRQTGPIGAMLASGRWVTVNAMVISRFEAGQACETWVTLNDFDVLRQLEAAEIIEPEAMDSREQAPPGPAAIPMKER
jgi:hypothetical protein